MLFDEKVSLCKIVKDSVYVVGKMVNMNISFGGNKDLSTAEDMFNNLKDLGTLPYFSYYIESKMTSKGVEIVYCVSELSLDCSKDMLSYRKVLLPRILSKYEVGNFVSEEIERNLNSISLSLMGKSIKVLSKKVKEPLITDIDKGIEFIKSVNSAGFNVFKSFTRKSLSPRNASPDVDNYAYCMIDSKTYILLTMEDDIREFAIVPLYYTNEEDILEYLGIVTNKHRELLVEMLPYILK